MILRALWTTYSTVSLHVGLMCSQYMNPSIARSGGCLTDLNSTSDYRFHPFRNTDRFLDLFFNIKCSNRWKDVQTPVASIVFNIRDIFDLLGLVLVDSCALLLHIFVPYEAVGQVAVTQQGEEAYSSTRFRT